jgi:hypothetical protein
MQTKTLKTISRIIFITGVLCILLSSIFHVSSYFSVLALVLSLVYFIGGWYFFKGYYPDGHPVFLFFLGYLYSGVFIGPVFASKQWPMADEMLRGSVLWSAVLIVVIVASILLKKDKYQKGLKHFLIEAIILLILSIIPVVILKV